MLNKSPKPRKRIAEIAQEISFLMPRIARRVFLSFFQSNEIPPTQLFAILTLSEKGPCHFRELCRGLHISAPTATGIIDRLEKAHFVKRLRDASDRRAIHIVLTAKGKRIARILRLTIRKRWEMMLRQLSLKECEDYLRILRKIQGFLS